MSSGFSTRYKSISKLVTSEKVLILPRFGAWTSKYLEEIFISMQNALKAGLCLEIGAYDASFSRGVKEKYGDAIHVCALEASPKTYQYFSEQIDFSKKNIEYINVAISNIDGCVVFHEYSTEEEKTARTLSSIHKRGNYNTRRDAVKVISKRGDTFIAEKFPDQDNIVLWIDVEGAQQEVLFSFEKLFCSNKINAVFIEVESEKLWPEQKMLVNDIIDFMKGHNFIPFLRDNPYQIQYNILFIRDDFCATDFDIFYDNYAAAIADYELRNRNISKDDGIIRRACAKFRKEGIFGVISAVKKRIGLM